MPEFDAVDVLGLLAVSAVGGLVAGVALGAMVTLALTRGGGRR